MKWNMMKKTVLFLGLLLLLYQTGKSQVKIWDETEEQKQERMAWWTHDRFGMFIHWGLYAMPARHEWVMRYEKIPVEEYHKYFELFEPDLYDPHEWAKMAKAAGMNSACSKRIIRIIRR